MKLTLSRLLILTIAILSIIASVLHPLGDAPDEYEHVEVIAFMSEHWRLPMPEDRLMQGVHPPLAFGVYAAIVKPIDALVQYLPAKVMIPWPYRIEIPLSRPGKFIVKEDPTVHLDSPGGFRAGTLYILRLIAVLFSLGGIALTMRTAMLFAGDQPAAVFGAASILLLTPMTVVQWGAIASEPLLLLFAGWAAFELAKGLRKDMTFSPVRAGLAIAATALVRHAGTLVVEEVFVVLMFRWNWIGRGRAVREMLVTCAIGLAGVTTWLLYNYVNTGDATLVNASLKWHPQLFRALPAGVGEFDMAIHILLTSYFGKDLSGIAPMASIVIIYLAIAAGFIIAGIASSFRTIQSPIVSPLAVLFFALTGAHIALMPPILANAVAPHGHGRFLITGIPFILPILVWGFVYLFDRRKVNIIANLLFAFSVVSAFITIFFVLAPTFYPPSSRVNGALAYTKCGSQFDVGRVRGTPGFSPDSSPFQTSLTTIVSDPQRVEYSFGMSPGSTDLTLTAAILGGSLGGMMRGMFDYPIVDVRVGGEIVASRFCPLPGIHRYQFAIPPSAVKDGTLQIAFDPVGAVPIVAVAEIRVQEGSDPLVHEKDLYTRICSAGFTGVGTRIFASDSRSKYVKHLDRLGVGLICNTGNVALPRGDYELYIHFRKLERSNHPISRLRVSDSEGKIIAVTEVTAQDAPLDQWTRATLPFKITSETATTVNADWLSTGLVEFEADDIEIHVVRSK